MYPQEVTTTCRHRYLCRFEFVHDAERAPSMLVKNLCRDSLLTEVEAELDPQTGWGVEVVLTEQTPFFREVAEVLFLTSQN